MEPQKNSNEDNTPLSFNSQKNPVPTPTEQPTSPQPPQVFASAQSEDANQPPSPSTNPSVLPANPSAPPSSQPGQVFVNGSSVQATGQSWDKPKNHKPVLAILIALFLIAFGSLGYIFGFYIPNQPENVWSSGLNNTGKEFSAFIDKLNDPEAFQQLASNKVTVSGDIQTKEVQATLNFDSTYDKSASDSKLNLSMSSEGEEAQDINLDALVKTQLPEDSIYPNVYFNITGFKMLGLDLFMPGISDYDGKWISMEQDFYEEYLSQSDTTADDQSNVTQQDVVSVLQDVNEVAKEYVFTDNPEKAVIVMEEFVGSEQSEGIEANHYKASIHEQHAKEFCEAVVDKLYANESFLKISQTKPEDAEESKKDDKKDCETTEDKEDTEAESTTFDLWIDKKHKVFHKIRVYEDLEKENEKWETRRNECLDTYREFQQNSDSDSFCKFYDDYIETGEKYVEYGQIFSSSDEIHFFATAQNKTNKSDNTMRFDLTLKVEGLLLNGTINYQDNQEDSKGSANFTIKTEPHEGEVESKKPDGAIPLQKVLDKLEANANNRSRSQLGAQSDDEVEPRQTWLERLEDLLLVEDNNKE